MKQEEEYILCAANHYDDLHTHDHQPKNIKSGFVICGHRHHNCISIFAQMVGFPYSDESMVIHRTERQGFLTNTNRFVDRHEGAAIAMSADQIADYSTFNMERLFSEDLY